MAILNCTSLNLAFGSNPLLDDAQFTLEAKERVCLVGRNGCGKSSFLKMIGGIYQPDAGTIKLQGSCSLEYLAQNVPDGITGTLAEFLAAPFQDVAQQLSAYQLLMAKAGPNGNDHQPMLRHHGAW